MWYGKNHVWLGSPFAISDFSFSRLHWTGPTDVQYCCRKQWLQEFHSLVSQVRLCLFVCFGIKRHYFSLRCEFCTLNSQHVSFLPRLINVTIDFQLKAINIQTIINNEIPDCYTFAITVSSSMISNSVNIPQYRNTKDVVFLHANSHMVHAFVVRLWWITGRTAVKLRSVFRTVPPLRSVKTLMWLGVVSDWWLGGIFIYLPLHLF